MQVVQPYPQHAVNGHNQQTIPGYPPYTSYAFAPPPPYSVSMTETSARPPDYYPPSNPAKSQ